MSEDVQKKEVKEEDVVSYETLLLGTDEESDGGIYKSLTADTEGSKQVKPKDTKNSAASVVRDFNYKKVAKPSFDMNAWALMPDYSTRLAQSIRLYARNTVGLGWRVKPIISITRSSPNELRERYNYEKSELLDLLEMPNDETPFSDVMFMSMTDKLTLGNGYIEVVRNNSGKIVELYHVKSKNIRVMKNGKGYVQKIGNKFIYFKKFGISKNMDKTTGEFGERIPLRKRASEIIHYKEYNTRDDYYGVPRYRSTAPSIMGNRAAAERNLAFFENDAPQPLDAKVLTPEGWATMGEVSKGDYVIGVDGKSHLVLEDIPQGVKDIYKVEFLDGTSTECTLNHVWTLSNNYDRRNNTTRNMSTKDILDEGIYYDCGTAKWAVPMVSPIEYGKKEKLPLDPYFLGVLLGDGCFTNSRVSMSAHNDDVAELTSIIKEILPSGVTFNIRNRMDDVGKNASEFSFVRESGVYRNELSRIMDSLGLLNVLGYNKFIPEKYLKSSIEERVSLLQGLVDSDGCIGDTSVRFVSTSLKLAEGVKEIVGSLGGAATIRKVSGRTTYQVTIRQLPEEIVPARLNRKADKYTTSSTLRWRTISNIVRTREAETKCIVTESEDSLYVTDDFIVTHNCPRMALMISGGKLASGSVEKIQKFLKAAKGAKNAHRMMVLQIDTEGANLMGSTAKPSVELKPLTVGQSDDASFLDYRSANNEEIREAFGIAKAFFSPDDVNKAVAYATKAITNEHEFDPTQKQIEHLFYHTIIMDMFSGNHAIEPKDYVDTVNKAKEYLDDEEIENIRKNHFGGIFFEKSRKNEEEMCKNVNYVVDIVESTGLYKFLKIRKDSNGDSVIIFKSLPLVKLVFNRPKVLDETQKSEVNEIYSEQGILTANEIRQELGYDPYPDKVDFGDTPLPLFRAGQVVMSDEEEESTGDSSEEDELSSEEGNTENSSNEGVNNE